MSASSGQSVKLRSFHVVLIAVLATGSTHIVSALHSNCVAAQGTWPHSAPWWLAWVLPAPVTFYVAVGSVVGAVAFLAVRFLSTHARS
jgi:hypothetical protein